MKNLLGIDLVDQCTYVVIDRSLPLCMKLSFDGSEIVLEAFSSGTGVGKILCYN